MESFPHHVEKNSNKGAYHILEKVFLLNILLPLGCLKRRWLVKQY